MLLLQSTSLFMFFAGRANTCTSCSEQKGVQTAPVDLPRARTFRPDVSLVLCRATRISLLSRAHTSHCHDDRLITTCCAVWLTSFVHVAPQEKISATVDKLTHKQHNTSGAGGTGTASTGAGLGGSSGTGHHTTGAGYDSTTTGAGYDSTTTGAGTGLGTSSGAGGYETSNVSNVGGGVGGGVTSTTTGTGEVSSCFHSPLRLRVCIACLPAASALVWHRVCDSVLDKQVSARAQFHLLTTVIVCPADHRPGDLHQDRGPRGAHREEEVRAGAQVCSQPSTPSGGSARYRLDVC